ncbi:MAG: molybdopterin-dependent oxidoreductase, partial [Thermodesulfobacteriota bacterium]|nr:molybdopterin-dependent oxidoreductase [Thermodesulfobacteriota bacterium]
MKLGRRTFIELAVGFAAGAGAGFMATPVNWKVMDDMAIWTQNWPWVPVPDRGPVAQADTICRLCPGGCGITVRKVEDRATKIEGRAGYPVNDGGICILGTAGLQLLYGPWRVPAPMKRIGKRGAGKWEKISWEAAIGEVVGKLADLRTNGEAHKVACVLGSDQGTVAQLFDRFLSSYGSPNFIRTTSCDDTYELATGLMEGVAASRAYDLERANFI